MNDPRDTSTVSKSGFQSFEGQIDGTVFARPLVFVTGKGGTGKTTFAAALAQALAARGRKVLVATSDPKENLSKLFGTTTIGAEVVPLRGGISAVNVEPEAALREYGEITLKSRLLCEAIFGNRYVRSFFEAVPGLHQWAVLGKAWFHSTERTASGKARFDSVILDAPATGHAIQMLWVPKIISEVARGGVLMRDAERAWQMLRDPTHTALVAVTLPEEVATTETLELAQALRDELQLVLSRVVVNGVVSPRLSEQEGKQLLALELGNVAPEMVSAARALVERAACEGVQRTSLSRLAAGLATPRIELPRLLRDVSDPEAVGELAKCL